ncbi:unnamed protein product [Haemonchus placei]|uniref:Uncharacterized protein n=1 Tax=Haemonchus placei TaxID=6290 RepID=A0A3P7Z7R8_HAEPC|nr:unnamed protein product [Haemonchus placei]
MSQASDLPFFAVQLSQRRLDALALRPKSMRWWWWWWWRWWLWWSKRMWLPFSSLRTLSSVLDIYHNVPGSDDGVLPPFDVVAHMDPVEVAAEVQEAVVEVAPAVLPDILDVAQAEGLGTPVSAVPAASLNAAVEQNLAVLLDIRVSMVGKLSLPLQVSALSLLLLLSWLSGDDGEVVDTNHRLLTIRHYHTYSDSP